MLKNRKMNVLDMMVAKIMRDSTNRWVLRNIGGSKIAIVGGLKLI